MQAQLGEAETQNFRIMNQASRYAAQLEAVKALPRFNVMKPNPTMDGSGLLRTHATKGGEWIRADELDKILEETK